MSAGHTSGPWVEQLFEGGGFEISAANQGSYGGTLVVCRRGGHSIRADEIHANARLIAAAPDLLEAAQAAWNCIGELPPTQARVEVAQLLQAAIEKATGEQP